MRRLMLWLDVLFGSLLVLALNATPSASAQVFTFARTTQPPMRSTFVLPPPAPGGSCIGGGISPAPETACCASGYVYLHNKPVANATVTFTANGQTFTTQTQYHAGNTQPYYVVQLDGAPLNVVPEQLVMLLAQVNEYSAVQAFIAVAGEQRVDVVLSQQLGTPPEAAHCLPQLSHLPEELADITECLP